MKRLEKISFGSIKNVTTEGFSYWLFIRIQQQEQTDNNRIMTKLSTKSGSRNFLRLFFAMLELASDNPKNAFPFRGRVRLTQATEQLSLSEVAKPFRYNRRVRASSFKRRTRGTRETLSHEKL
jgi:hypothetical protein